MNVPNFCRKLKEKPLKVFVTFESLWHMGPWEGPHKSRRFANFDSKNSLQRGIRNYIAFYYCLFSKIWLDAFSSQFQTSKGHDKPLMWLKILTNVPYSQNEIYSLLLKAYEDYLSSGNLFEQIWPPISYGFWKKNKK